MENSAPETRLPLSAVVADCAKRWFQETLKEAKAGDVDMQMLVSQMYCNGYGVSANPVEGRAWMRRATRHGSSASQVSEEHLVGNSISRAEAGKFK